jgi:hypothetical protein
MMDYDEVDRYMGPTLSRVGFTLEEVDKAIRYAERPAWAVYYRGPDCKLQVCWSAREGGIDFMLAPLDAPNEFGLINQSKKWRLMLALSELDDGLVTPPVDAAPEAWWTWRIALFNWHFEAARAALLRTS